MTTKIKIYIAAACVAILAAVILGSSLWADRKTARLTRELEAARQAADASGTAARELELTAAGYREKIEYLEESLSALRLTAKKQDEQLKTLENDTDNARRNFRRGRPARPAASSAADLCARLADLGHPCD